MVLIICHVFFEEALHVFPICFVANVYFRNEWTKLFYCSCMVKFIRKVSDSEQTKRAVLNEYELL